jgi:hypothetical protein
MIDRYGMPEEETHENGENPRKGNNVEKDSIFEKYEKGKTTRRCYKVVDDSMTGDLLKRVNQNILFSVTRNLQVQRTGTAEIDGST